jgi:hypothetical protein
LGALPKLSRLRQTGNAILTLSYYGVVNRLFFSGS